MSRFARLVAALATLAVGLPAAATANHSFPATYNGSTALGGSISFDVSGDGANVTRFERTGVVLNGCGGDGSSYLAAVPIVNHAFNLSQSSGSSFAGSFPSPGQASGTVRFKSMFCDSGDVSWTATGPITAPPPPPPPAGPPPPPGTGVGPDITRPLIQITDFFASRRSIGFETNCAGEACEVTARGTVSVPRTARVFRLRAVSRSVAAGGTTGLRLRMPRAAAAAIKRALAKKKGVNGKVTVTATDAAGNRSTLSRRFRIRR